ncbi:dipicolinate synthase subunit B [uncultured Ruminococcus sp.]|uniref:dipicolinate synthase subunit B n=1 Tax=uncultured Ruminococcus sp. TaxID=165186 RepID=UPI00261926C3|nr:dipicolinate synthase subunit B [uncultured Ruminococcus sp.]
MNDLTGERIGFVVTGSFCTFSAAFAQAAKLREAGAVLTPIFSEHAATIDTRFGKAADRVAELEEICGRPSIRTIAQAEPIGPKDLLDLLVVAPCTANTAAKLAHGITDSTATMAVKSMLRRQKPVVLAIATNDALGASAKNIGLLMNTKHYYFVPLRQDAPLEKPASLVADFTKLPETVEMAQQQKQIQPIFI